eukprot:UN06038
MRSFIYLFTKFQTFIGTPFSIVPFLILYVTIHYLVQLCNFAFLFPQLLLCGSVLSFS